MQTLCKFTICIIPFTIINVANGRPFIGYNNNGYGCGVSNSKLDSIDMESDCDYTGTNQESKGKKKKSVNSRVFFI